MRTLGDVAVFSAAPTDYLATGARVHWPWAARFLRGDGLFPGHRRDGPGGRHCGRGVGVARIARARMWLAMRLVSFCCSFGVNFPP